MNKLKEKLMNKKTLIFIALLLCVVTGISYAYFGFFVGEGANAIINVSTEQPDDLHFDVDKELSMTLNQFNFTAEAGNLFDTATAVASLKANDTTETADFTYNIYFNILSNDYIYTTPDHKPEIILTITDPSGNIVTDIEGLTYVTAGDVSGFDVTETRRKLISVSKDHAISSRSSKNATRQNWSFKINFINLETNQKDNAGKTFNAKIIIQEEEYQDSLADKCVGQNMSQCLKDNAALDPTLLHHDANLTYGAEDDSYRYTGANPNNYVCFGSDAETCPSANLYRIIGVFGEQTKLVHATYATTAELGTAVFNSENSFNWSGSEDNASNTWSESTLNTESLNGTFLNNLGPTWTDKIATTTWNVGGMDLEKIKSPSTVKDTYDYEVGANKSSTTYEAKIGMPYANEYGYAANSNYWTTSLNGYEITAGNNWMLLENNGYWTITRVPIYAVRAFIVGNDGGMGYGEVDFHFHRVRPTFNLVSSVKISSGEGTEANPYRIA